jgi:nitroimidazol reductase NimA-like FMN-containing flavoprotein (pyridoxamine 5'-phosphate oxidase superfamily)
VSDLDSPEVISPGPEAHGERGSLSVTARTRHRRLREQGRTDRADLDAVLAAGFVAHLGLPAADGVMVVPTVYGTDGQSLYLHGSVASQSLAADAPVCVTVTIIDGLVLARSVFEHAVNYRSAVIYAVPRIVSDPAEKLAGLRCISEHTAPGQWDYVRQPSRKELAATRLLALALDEASVKVRSGPPDDADSPDAALGLWAGELPLTASWQEPVADPALPPGQPVPPHIQAMAGSVAFPPPRAGQGRPAKAGRG